MENKNETVKSLMLFLVLTFVITYGIHLPYFINYGYYDEKGVISNSTSLILAISMLIPTVCMLITRAVRREGYNLTGEDSMLLGIDFSKGKWIFFVLAVLVPWLTSEAGSLIDMCLFPDSMDIEGVDGEQLKVIWGVPFLCLTIAIVNSFGALGEEAGWRGYMMPKLEKLFGIKWAVIIGGLIWSVWHYGSIIYGHNFGLDYMGAPFSGLTVFTVFAVFENAFLTFLTKKTGSVWPAAFAHAANNSNAAICLLLINTDKLPLIESTFGIIRMCPMLIVGIVCLIMLSKNADEDTNNSQKN